ncbi:MAG: SAV_6107 family HEPN domain-containing protein [Nocardioidaceae bacterium]
MTEDVLHRYACAHVAALRAAAAVLAVRARPSGRSGQRNVQRNAQRNSQRNAWELLVAVAPELAEWAVLFSSCARKRAAAEAGLRSAVTQREADDQLRDAERFLLVVGRAIGVPDHLPLDTGVRWSPAQQPTQQPTQQRAG